LRFLVVDSPTLRDCFAFPWPSFDWKFQPVWGRRSFFVKPSVSRYPPFFAGALNNESLPLPCPLLLLKPHCERGVKFGSCLPQPVLFDMLQIPSQPHGRFPRLRQGAPFTQIQGPPRPPFLSPFIAGDLSRRPFFFHSLQGLGSQDS